jgi:hypothetical protein
MTNHFIKINCLKLFIYAGAFGIVAMGMAQTNSESPVASGSRIEFADPNFDFGKVDSGMAVKHDFIFTNTGDQPLEIKDVRPACGCTTAGSWDKNVEPGKTGKISIQFNSAGYSGAVHKVVSVTSNDPTKTNVILGFQGSIWKAFDVSPSYAVFNLHPEGQTNETQIIKIISNNDQPITVFDPACDNPAFKTELKTTRDGKEFELHVTVIASQVPSSSSAPITLKTSSEKMPVISITAFAMVQPLLTVNPPQIALPPGSLPNPMSFTLTIQNNGTNDVVLSEPHINAEGVGIQLKERQHGRDFNLMVNFPAGFQSQPAQNIQATVKTTNPKFPLIQIPIIQPALPTAIGTPVVIQK